MRRSLSILLVGKLSFAFQVVTEQGWQMRICIQARMLRISQFCPNSSLTVVIASKHFKSATSVTIPSSSRKVIVETKLDKCTVFYVINEM